MKRLLLSIIAVLVLTFTARASDPGSGGCYACAYEYHHTTITTCYETDSPPAMAYEVPCSWCTNPNPAFMCEYRHNDYDWTCSYCTSSAQHVGGFVGSQCIMGMGPATGYAPPNWYGPCPSCTTYGECSTEGRLEQLDGSDDEATRLAQIEPGTSIASMVQGLQKLMTPDDYGALEDRISAETASLAEPARSITTSHLYALQLRDVAQARNAMVMSARAFGSLNSTPTMLRR